MAGTDFTFKKNGVRPSAALHEELALLVEAGLSPMQALQATTLNPAKFLNMMKTYGTIEKGEFADVILLEANRLEDIRNAQRIDSVVINGRYLSKEMLRKMIADAES